MVVPDRTITIIKTTLVYNKKEHLWQNNVCNKRSKERIILTIIFEWNDRNDNRNGKDNHFNNNDDINSKNYNKNNSSNNKNRNKRNYPDASAASETIITFGVIASKISLILPIIIILNNNINHMNIWFVYSA